MKTKIALVVTLTMVFTSLMSGVIFAAGDPGLESAIKTVKQTFDIPEDYSNFSYSISTYDETKVWDLNWNSKDDNGSSIQVTIDSTGDIISYNNYKYLLKEQTKKLPSISKSEAQKKAEEIIKKLSPVIFGSLKMLENTQSTSINDNTYSFDYIRTHNGIPFPQNGISVYINKQTGELQSYNKNWTKDITFPSSEKALSLKEAQEAYIKNLGLELIYNYSTDKDGIKVFGVYTPKYNAQYYIDALTGEKVYLGGAFNDFKSNKEAASDLALTIGRGDNEVALTPEEIDAVEEVSKFISQEEAETIARNLKYLELDNSFKLESARLFKGWFDLEDYQWNLYFSNSSKEDYRIVQVRINATTGEIINFYTYYSTKADQKPKFDEAASKKAVEEFLKEIQPDKFKETKYKEKSDEPIRYESEETPAYFDFTYTRMVNGISFPGNYISVTYDAISGKIASYNLTWYNAEFPSLENAEKLDKIYEIFFKDIGLELQYTSVNTDVIYSEKVAEPSKSKNETKLVYTVKSDKPSTLDAITGIILDNNGKPYKEKKALEYNDISGHYAQDEIELLAETGIGLEGPELKPNEKIKQKDFLLLISQVISNGYEFYGKNALSSNTEIDNLYKLLIQEGIVKESEKNPEAVLTREDSVKFVIRALNYEKIAAMSDIFNCTFKDKDDITPELIGHVVIAKGLGIVSGDGEYFRPKSELKRADALIIIYNYLKI
jgi:hypothetical protein